MIRNNNSSQHTNSYIHLHNLLPLIHPFYICQDLHFLRQNIERNGFKSRFHIKLGKNSHFISFNTRNQRMKRTVLQLFFLNSTVKFVILINSLFCVILYLVRTKFADYELTKVGDYKKMLCLLSWINIFFLISFRNSRLSYLGALLCF